MQNVFSFRTRLLISTWAVLVVALLLPATYFYTRLAQKILSDARNESERQLSTVYDMLSEGPSFQNEEHLRSWINTTGRHFGIRITYMSDAGSILADSQIPLSDIPSFDGFASRPEILESRDRRIGFSIRSSRILPKEQIFVARKVIPQGSVAPGILRLAIPFSQVRGLLDDLKFGFLVIAGLAFAGTFCMSFMITRHLADLIRIMVDAADAVTSRNYKQRICSSASREFYPLAQSLNRMAASVEHHVQSISEEHKQLETVFNGMREGVMVLDRRGRIQRINAALAQLVPNVAHAIGRRPLEVFMNLELQEACDQTLVSTAIQEEHANRSLQITLNDVRVYDVNIVRLNDRESGEGAVIVFHDITELKRLEKVRQDFVANVSHELMTPLSSIKSHAEDMLTEIPQQTGVRPSVAANILESTNHLIKMVQDLLQLARLEAAERPSHPVVVSARQAFSTACRSCAALIQTREVVLQDELPDTNLRVFADFDQLVQVFRNLLENAVKHTPAHGHVTVSCLVQQSMMRFAVKDEGPGIPAIHQQRIFERFYRVRRNESIPGGSTGLGLAVCRHIIRNHGGSIWVQSPDSDGKDGATFYFTLRPASEGYEKAAGPPLETSDAL